MAQSSFSQYLTKHPIDHGYNILPGIWANPAWGKHVATDMIPSLLRVADGPVLSSYGITGFDRLLNMPGYTMDPWPLPRAVPEMKTYKYDHDVELAVRWIIETLAPRDEFRTVLCTEPCGIRPEANFGLPSFSTDLAYKTAELVSFCQNIQNIMNVFHKRDYKRLADEHGIVFCSVIRRRFQPDSVKIETDGAYNITKATFKDRSSPIGNGTEVIANKSLEEAGFLPLLCRTRVRLVQAMPMKANFFGMPVNNAFNACRFRNAPFTTHASDVGATLATLGDRLREREPLAVDIKGLDTHTNIYLIDLILYTMQEVWGLSSEFVEWMRCLAYSPWVCNGIWHEPGRDPKDGYSGGSYLNPLFRMWEHVNGIASGLIFTTALGCLSVLSVSAAAGMKLHAIERSKRGVAEWLQWHSDAVAPEFDQGDDQLLWPKQSWADAYRHEYPDAFHESYTGYHVEIDDIPSYLSRLVIRDADGKWIDRPDIARGLAKTFVCESSKHHIYASDTPYHNRERMLAYMGINGSADPSFLRASTRFPMFGLRTRNAMWEQQHPAFAIIWGTVLESISRFNPNTVKSMDDLARLEEEALQSMNVEAASLVDREVIEDPSKAMWKFKRDEISDGVYKLFYSSIPVEVVAKLKPFILE